MLSDTFMSHLLLNAYSNLGNFKDEYGTFDTNAQFDLLDKSDRNKGDKVPIKQRKNTWTHFSINLAIYQNIRLS
jgi:hypothetical protein